MDSKFFHYLKQLNLTSESTRSLFNIGTRDQEDLKVWREEVSGVIFIDDFLLSVVSNEPFKKFTLWRQHLVLHTRESLLRTLKFVGLEDIQIEGVQRYSLSNHFHWLANRKAEGHKSPLSVIDSKLLSDAYESSLVRIDATDTLVAIAKVP